MQYEVKVTLWGHLERQHQSHIDWQSDLSPGITIEHRGRGWKQAPSILEVWDIVTSRIF